MINFSKVRYKNFLSTGQQFIEVDLQKSNTTLVVGENGAGKSTMLDALCFGLFQRAFRNIKKDQLINSLNERDCVVEVYFTVGQKSYKIVTRKNCPKAKAIQYSFTQRFMIPQQLRTPHLYILLQLLQTMIQ